MTESRTWISKRGWIGALAVLASAGVANSAPWEHGHSRCRPASFDFVEESDRLPDFHELSKTSSTGVNLVDVDGDGDLDLFLAQGTDGLDVRPNQLFENDGSGYFTDASAVRLPSGADSNSTKADFADIDGDGDLDAVVANLGPETLLVNDGSGIFSDASEQLPPAPDLLSDISSNAQFAEVNGDGCPDILVSNENPFDPDPLHGAQNRLWINDCSGRFSDETTTRLPAGTDQTAGILSGDIDADGDTDIVVLDRGQDLVWINDGWGQFSDQTSLRFPVVTDSTRSGALVDVNGDGSLDLLTSNSRGEPPRLYLNSGGGYFREGSFGYTEEQDETDTQLLAEDLNGDGFVEVYLANAGKFSSGHGFSGGVDHLFSDCRGSFSLVPPSQIPFPASQASTGAAFGDIDGDGDLDLVVAGTGDGEVGRERVFLQRRRGCDRSMLAHAPHPSPAFAKRRLSGALGIR